MALRQIVFRLALVIAVALPLMLCTVSWGESGCHKGCGTPKVDTTKR